MPVRESTGWRREPHTVIAGVLGSDWVFEGDQTLNFTVSSSYSISAPDLTPPSTTGGEWTATPAYDEGAGLTTFTDTKASFGAFMRGWFAQRTTRRDATRREELMPNVEQPSYLTIFGVPPGGLSVEVRGDATGLGASGATYRVIAPPGVDPTTGALSKPASVLSKRADNRG